MRRYKRKDLMSPFMIMCFLMFFWLSGIQHVHSDVMPDEEERPWGDITFTDAEKQWMAQKHKIRVRVAFWPPFQKWENGPKGISIDYLKAIGSRCNLDFVFYEAVNGWGDALEDMKYNQYVDLMPTITRTPERETFVAFTKNYLFLPRVIFTRTDGGFIGGIDDLYGKTVSVQRNYVTHKILENEYPEIELLVVDSTLDAMKAVSTGKCDAFIGNLAVGTYLIQNYGLLNVKVAAPTPFETHNNAMGVRKDWPDLAGIMNKALAAMPQEEHSRIRQKWLTMRYEYGISWTEILMWSLAVVGSLSIIFMIILIWNWRLKKAYENLALEIAGHQSTQKKLKDAKETAEAANRAKSTFLANMSHELRTPMNAILGFARLTSQNKQLPSEICENLRVINRSGEHLLNLINDVLDMSKIEAGRTVLNEKDFDLHHMLDDLENMLSMSVREKNLNMTFKRDPDVIQYVRADEVKLRQTLINLISNAVKFTEQGEIRLLIKHEPSKETSESENRLVFEVRDTGPGIAAEELPHLFEAFAQTETGRRSQEGTGLGLPISRKFVRLMGGDITVDSKEGTGTIFRFDIRVRPADGPDVQQIQPSQRVIGLEPGQAAYRILVADDRADNRRLLVKLLLPLGFDVREAENGAQAVEIRKQWNPHLIWMDMRMPVMNGCEAIRKIKETSEGRATPVIALTAGVYDEEQSAVMSAGCDGFVRKPFREHEIFEEMARHLGVRYVYESSPAEDEPSADEKKVLTPGDLLIMPDAWQTAFRDVVVAGYFDDCLELIEQIPADHVALSSGLKHLVDNFAFDKLVQLTAKTEKNDDIQK